MILGFIITVGVCCGYAFIGGLFGWLFYKTSSKRCEKCRNDRCYSDHGMAAGFVAISWPLTLPACAGGMVANHLVSGEERAKVKAAHEDRDHQRRMAELGAEQKLAREQKERTLADIRFLAENGIHADVPGLYEAGMD